MVIDDQQAQRHIDDTTERIFNQGIENATQADLMFFGFGYLARVITHTRARPSSHSFLDGNLMLPLGMVLGAGLLQGVMLVRTIF